MLFKRIKTVKAVKSFEAVLEILSDVKYINYGGCGIAALAMYRWLKANKLLKRSTCFYFLENNPQTHNNNKKSIKDNNCEPTSTRHVILYHDNKYFDSNGEYSIGETYKLRIKSEKFVVKAINNIGTWNNVFDREMCVPVIAKKLGVNLNDIQLSREDFFNLNFNV